MIAECNGKKNDEILQIWAFLLSNSIAQIKMLMFSIISTNKTCTIYLTSQKQKITHLYLSDSVQITRPYNYMYMYSYYILSHIAPTYNLHLFLISIYLSLKSNLT